MSGALVDALIESIAELGADLEVRAIIVTGAGPGFCAGSDLAGLAAMSPGSRRTFEERSGLAARMWGQCPKPTLAAVHGFAIGGGLTLAAACDIVVTDANSRWSLPEVPVGLFPAWGLNAVSARVGKVKTRRLAFGDAQWDGRQAHAAGLCDHVDDDPLAFAKQIALRLADLPQSQVAAVKRYFDCSIAEETADARANSLFMQATETAEAEATFKRFGSKKS